MISKKNLALVPVVAVGAIGLLWQTSYAAAPLPGAATASPTPTDAKKVWICKYVQTPGTGEILRDNNNPQDVSVNATVGEWFKDGQLNSYVLAYVVDGEPRPSADLCPNYPQPSTPPSSAPPSSAPPSSVPPTSVPPTSVPPTSVPPTSAPVTSAPATSVPPTAAPSTKAPATTPPGRGVSANTGDSGFDPLVLLGAGGIATAIGATVARRRRR